MLGQTEGPKPRRGVIITIQTRNALQMESHIYLEKLNIPL